MKVQCACLAILLVVAAGQAAPSPAAAPTGSPAAGELSCEEMCSHSTGLGADTCVTECQTHTDVAEDEDESLGDCVEDRSYNEPSGKGGEAMEEAYEQTYGSGTIPSCRPQFEGKVTFEDVDGNGDGIVTADEALAFGEKMCVSDEMTMQMFQMADANQDKQLTPEEYSSVGEESAAEEAMDKATDSVSEGDQEYNEVKAPQFEEFDKDGDGLLNDDEVSKAIMFELSRRFPGKSDEELMEIATDLYSEGKLKFLVEIDSDGDGMVSKEEWEAPEEGTPENLGTEIAEAAAADENAEDPDDLPTAEQSEPPAAPAPAAVAFHARPVVFQRGDNLRLWRALLARHLHRAVAHRRGAHGLRLQRAARPVAQRNLLARVVRHAGRRHHHRA